MTEQIRQLFATLTDGMERIDLNPTPDYHQHISTPAELNARAWQMTGDALRFALDTIGERYAESKL